MKKNVLLLILTFFCSVVFSEKFYTGDGGKNISIEVDNVIQKNITDEAEWLPDFIVNTVSTDIQKYSAIQVIDVKNLDKISASQKRDEKAGFNEEQLVEVGNFSIAKNILIAEVIGKNTSYSVTIKINDKEKATTVASYNNPNCTFTELESGKVLKQAVADLLEQLDVNLTSEGKQKLLTVNTVESQKSIQGQKEVAKGLAVAAKGSTVESLGYFIKAHSYDNNLLIASNAIKKSSQVIASGNYGERARNLIKQQEAFAQLIQTVTNIYKENPPVILVCDEMKQGQIDYKNKRYNMTFKSALVTDVDSLEMVDNIRLGYKNSEDSEHWGLSNNLNHIIPFYNYYITYNIVNKNGNVLGSTTMRYVLSSSDYYYSEDVNISIDANEDSQYLKLQIADIKISERYISNISSSLGKLQSIQISQCNIDEYQNNIMNNLLQVTPTKVRDVNYLTVTDSLNTDQVTHFLRYFKNMTFYDYYSKIYNLYYFYDVLMFESERAVLSKYSSRDLINETGRRNVYSDHYVLTKNPKFWRDKEQVKKEPEKYFPFEFIRYKNSDYAYLNCSSDYQKLYSEIFGHEVRFISENDRNRKKSDNGLPYTTQELFQEKNTKLYETLNLKYKNQYIFYSKYSDSDFGKEYDQIQQMYSSDERLSDIGMPASEKALNKLEKKIDKNQKKSVFQSILTALAVIIGIGYFLFKKTFFLLF